MNRTRPFSPPLVPRMSGILFLPLVLASGLLLSSCGPESAGGESVAEETAGAGMQSASRALTSWAKDGKGSRLDISRIGYDQGSPSAPLKIVEISDFGCGYCRLFNQQTYPSLVKGYIERGAVQWKFVPFSLGAFPNGREAAIAAECAGQQGTEAFLRMRDRLFAEQSGWRNTSTPLALFRRIAEEEGLDEDRFDRCQAGEEAEARLKVNARLGAALGVRGTPFFLVDGFPVPGALPLETFQQLLDGLLQASPDSPRGWLPTLPGPEGMPVSEVVASRTTGYSVGSEDAPLHLIEFSDFGCGYCRVFQEQTRPALVEQFVEAGLLRWTYVPVVLGIFPNGEAAAVAGECAGEQDRFEPVRRRLYRDQAGWRGRGDPTSLFVEMAREEGLDGKRFATCMGESEPLARVRENTRVGQQVGVRGTPFFLVNGFPISGARPLESFQDHFELKLNAVAGDGSGAG